MPALSATLPVHHLDVVQVAFHERVARDDLSREVRLELVTDAGRMPHVDGITAASTPATGSPTILVETDGAVATVTLAGGSVRIRIAGRDEDACSRLGDRLRAAFSHESVGRRAEVRFWFWGSGVAQRRLRTVTVPSWEEIRANYATRTAAAVEELVRDFEPGRAGRLLVWHGPPGTGKTFAVRALIDAWRGWCDAEYVTDPETLLEREPAYLMEMLLAPGVPGAPDRWRLLVLEDAGELLDADARVRTGQGVSRLLNAMDGILGQGTRVLVLITTNEPLASLHPAVVRPGRCASEIEFDPLDADHAARWLADHGHTVTHAAPATLAELHAVLRGDPEPRPPRLLGFR